VLGTRSRLSGTDLDYYALDRLREGGVADPAKLPMTIKVLLEGLLRQAETGGSDEVSMRALANWPAPPTDGAQLPYTPARVLLQDFTGVPAAVSYTHLTLPTKA